MLWPIGDGLHFSLFHIHPVLFEYVAYGIYWMFVKFTFLRRTCYLLPIFSGHKFLFSFGVAALVGPAQRSESQSRDHHGSDLMFWTGLFIGSCMFMNILNSDLCMWMEIVWIQCLCSSYIFPSKTLSGFCNKGDQEMQEGRVWLPNVKKDTKVQNYAPGRQIYTPEQSRRQAKIKTRYQKELQNREGRGKRQETWQKKLIHKRLYRTINENFVFSDRFRCRLKCSDRKCQR